MESEALGKLNTAEQQIASVIASLDGKIAAAARTPEAQSALRSEMVSALASVYTSALQSAKQELSEAIRAEGERVDKKRRDMFVNVRDYGAVGDGVTDDAPAIAAAIEAGGNGAHIYFPKGTYLCNSQLRFKRSQRVEGAAEAWGDIQDGSCLKFTVTQGEAVVFADANLVSAMRFEGPGASATGVVGVTTTSYVTMRDCSFMHWDVATRFTESWYTDLTRCKWEFNNVAIWAKYCYNLTVNSPHILANPDWNTGGIGILLEDSTMMTVHGGAIESFSTGVEIRRDCSFVSFGVYYESKVAYKAAEKRAILFRGQKSNVVCIGSQVYMTDLLAFVDGAAAEAGTTCTMIGNKFKGGVPTDRGVVIKTVDNNVGNFKLASLGDSTTHLNWEQHPYRSQNPGKGSFVMDPSGFFPGKGRHNTIFTNAYVIGGEDGGIVAGAGTKFPETSGDGVAGIAGLLYFRTDLNKLFLFNGSAWFEVMLGDKRRR